MDTDRLRSPSDVTEPRPRFSADGDVLVAGGENGVSQGSLSDAELYDPSTGTFSPTGSLNVARSFVNGALLPDGDVLVAGGISNVPSALSSAEVYDPATQSWSLTTPMNAASYRLTPTVLLRRGRARHRLP